MKRQMEIAFLTLEDVLALHDELIQHYGGSPGLRDAGLLEAAVAMPQSGFGGQYFHEMLMHLPPTKLISYDKLWYWKRQQSSQLIRRQ
jgi:hypothetical protein